MGDTPDGGESGDDELGRLAELLNDAWERAEAVPAPTRSRPSTTLEEAYRIQDRVIEKRLSSGRAPAGWKLGLTSSPDATPIVGTLLDDMVVESGVRLDPNRMVAPLIEGELAFVAGEAIPAGSEVETIARGPHHVAPALEVIDYRTVEADGVVDWVADNSTVAYAVVGPHRPLADIGPLAEIALELRQDEDLLATGDGSLVMGDPLNTIVWLANHLHQRGRSLEPGAVVLTGSLTGHHPARTGPEYVADFGDLGSAAVTFGSRRT